MSVASKSTDVIWNLTKITRSPVRAAICVHHIEPHGALHPLASNSLCAPIIRRQGLNLHDSFAIQWFTEWLTHSDCVLWRSLAGTHCSASVRQVAVLVRSFSQFPDALAELVSSWILLWIAAAADLVCDSVYRTVEVIWMVVRDMCLLWELSRLSEYLLDRQCVI